LADWTKVIFELGDIRILFHLKEKGRSRYHELQDDVIESRSTLAASLRNLQKMGLISRRIKDTRPIQTEYLLTERGNTAVHLLIQLKNLLEEK